MKTASILCLLAIFVLPSCSQINLKKLQEASDKAQGTILGGGSSSLSQEEIVKGLKNALEVGTNAAVGLASAEDGFYKNPLLYIVFPEEAQKVRDKALALGLNKQVEDFELALNRAAELAAKEAAPIFIDAITSMTVQDGYNILHGADNAATTYLNEKTSAQLRAKFQPIVQKAIDSVELTKYWTPLINAYNTATILTGAEDIDPDLEAYVTGKAIDGLFIHIAEKEKDIRKNPLARINDILKKVFSSLD
jgi:hypothetical protein